MTASTRSKRYRDSDKGREINQRYYQTAKYRRGMERRRAEKRLRFRQLIDLLKSVPCMDCGGTFDPVCMDFDHRPGEVKVFGIGSKGTMKPERVVRAEAAKCDVVCANCHRLRTYRQRNHRIICGQEPAPPASTTQLSFDAPAISRTAAIDLQRVDSIGTCRLCGYTGPGPRHTCLREGMGG